jgi:beta-phosphoglucomutase-like phosphatase (HAD superfamily)
MDGLMLETEPLYKTAWQQACAQLGFTLDDVTYSTFIGRPADESEVALGEHLGPRFPLSKFRARWPELWQACVRDRGIRCKDGLLRLLTFLDERSIPRAVATSSDADYTAFSLRHAGLEGRFEIIVTRDQVTHGKPAPDLYIEAARRLVLDPGECVALEDSDAGVLAATAAGMPTLCVPDLLPVSAAAARAARRVLGSLDEAREVIAAALAK